LPNIHTITESPKTLWHKKTSLKQYVSVFHVGTTHIVLPVSTLKINISSEMANTQSTYCTIAVFHWNIQHQNLSRKVVFLFHSFMGLLALKPELHFEKQIDLSVKMKRVLLNLKLL